MNIPISRNLTTFTLRENEITRLTALTMIQIDTKTNDNRPFIGWDEGS